ncbi:MAG: methylmalonate-semialdehyde dehydrogenase (CoA acylating) [Planctomycetota bacterium]|nr:MAG: methylmalonate-semialdehyde dehydrogenase (CoA acylating) [Planctomycetota bacterium]REK20227.1 MAG: methylmalonate-semialdehyde dehydrogenase (CoA acylating) [Planctomycetota bacterium]REK35319.1 MAG: methylmalonate-semialdehyde dehydrogenase (CoA acylating) [Planctomycetota bacterium]
MPTEAVLNLIGGTFQAASTDRFEDVFNPSTGEIIAQVPLSGREDAQAAVIAAGRALSSWSQTPVIDRARVMFRYRDLLEQHFDDVARLITRENGKTLAESRAELRRGIEVVEFACGIPSLFMGRSLADVARDVDADVMRHPVGVCAGITPYNFPAMVPMWMFPIALVCGNSFILKPSEKVPLTANRIGELLLQAGCPEGVFNVLHGGRECVDALLESPGVAAISFVGSTPVAREIYRRGAEYGKRVQAAGGAKNFCLVMPDADPVLAVQALAAASFGCGGQRCMATSIAVPVGDAADSLIDRLAQHAGSLRVGPTHEGDDVDLGPLIRAQHVERVCSHIESAAEGGATVVLDGRRSEPGGGFFLDPSIVDHVAPEMDVARTEIFGPLLSVIRAATLNEALRMGRDCEFGNGASIFTRDGYAARRFRDDFPAGMIGINVGVPAPMAWFPFTGWNNSFFGDLHVQGTEGIQFYTRQKVTLTRWLKPTGDDPRDPVWRGS